MKIYSGFFSYIKLLYGQVSTRDNVYAKKKILIFFLVHKDRKNVQETPDFDACMETHIMHTHGA